MSITTKGAALSVLLTACHGGTTIGIPDTSADTAADTTLEDTAADTPDDTAADTAADPVEDTPLEDGPPACGDLDVTATDLDAWTICFMGSGTHAHFTLRYDNPHDCDITGVTVASGSLRLASDDSPIFDFGVLAPEGGFSGTVEAGSSAEVQYAADDPGDGSELDGALVHVDASVTWDGGGPVGVQTPTATLTCVY